MNSWRCGRPRSQPAAPVFALACTTAPVPRLRSLYTMGRGCPLIGMSKAGIAVSRSFVARKDLHRALLTGQTFEGTDANVLP